MADTIGVKIIRKFKNVFAYVFRFMFHLKFLQPCFHGVYKKIIQSFELYPAGFVKVKEKGFTWEIQPSDWIGAHIFFTGNYEYAEQKFMTAVLKKGDVVLDIGSHIGWHALHMAKLVENDGMIFAFEPFSQNFEILKKNIFNNNLSQIVPFKVAVSNFVGEYQLHYETSLQNSGMASLKTSFTEKAVENTEVISIDNFFSKTPIERIDFVKIDTEGNEDQVIEGMKMTLVKFRPTLMIEILTKESLYAIKQQLWHLGYVLYSLSSKGELLMKNFQPPCNAVFLPEELHQSTHISSYP